VPDGELQARYKFLALNVSFDGPPTWLQDEEATKPIKMSANRSEALFIGILSDPRVWLDSLFSAA
jgi:hypothetical protein